jgi:hypothetical protein
MARQSGERPGVKSFSASPEIGPVGGTSQRSARPTGPQGDLAASARP